MSLIAVIKMSTEIRTEPPNVARLRIEIPGRPAMDIVEDVHLVHDEIGKMLSRLDGVERVVAPLDAEMAEISDPDGRLLRLVEEFKAQTMGLMAGIAAGLEKMTVPEAADLSAIFHEALGAAQTALETPAIADLRARVQRNKLRVVDDGEVVGGNGEVVGGKVPDPLPEVNARSEELRARLKHPSPTVREGAVYGLARLAKRFPEWAAEAVPALSDVAANDESPGVREAAAESLEDLR